MTYTTYGNGPKPFGLLYMKYDRIMIENPKAVKFKFDKLLIWFPKAVIAIDDKIKVLVVPSIFAEAKMEVEDFLVYDAPPYGKIRKQKMRAKQDYSKFVKPRKTILDLDKMKEVLEEKQRKIKENAERFATWKRYQK